MNKFFIRSRKEVNKEEKVERKERVRTNVDRFDWVQAELQQLRTVRTSSPLSSAVDLKIARLLIDRFENRHTQHSNPATALYVGVSIPI